MQLIEQAFSDDPALDLAVSHALLRRVAAGAGPATLRLYRPGPTVAFGRLDALEHGFGAAIAAARAHGFVPALRTAGGRAAAYTGEALVVDEITPQPGLAVEVRERFEAFAGLIAGALRDVGADARVGAVAGEYCPGDYSVNADGKVKLAGVAQRLIRGAALVSAVIVLGDAGRVREVLSDVYARLGVVWEPRTVGALVDVAPGADARGVSEALLARRRPSTRAPLDDETLALARVLRARASLDQQNR